MKCKTCNDSLYQLESLITGKCDKCLALTAAIATRPQCSQCTISLAPCSYASGLCGSCRKYAAPKDDPPASADTWRMWLPTDPDTCACGIYRNNCTYHR